MREVIIAPSVLSLDYSAMSKEVEQLDHSAAEWIHFDVMDGHFVPNLTFGPDILRGYRNALPEKLMDVHLMVEDPMKFIQPFYDAGADIITFHKEACSSEGEFIGIARTIRGLGALAGVSIKPNTSVEEILPFLHEIDLVLIMSVEPGFGGQSFMEEMLEKVRALRRVIDESKLDVKIEIDGGINEETSLLAKEAGVDVLVAGSYIFKGNIEERIQTLL